MSYVRSFLVVPPYEQISYPLNELSQLSRAIYDNENPTILVWRLPMNLEDINIIRFLGSSYPPEADLSLKGDPANVASCDRRWPTADEPVAFCNMLDLERLVEICRNNIRVLLLRSIDDIEDEASFAPKGNELTILMTQNFRLSILSCPNSTGPN